MGQVAAPALIGEQDTPPSRPPARKRQTTRRDITNILFITSEFSDLIKVGGLGDVSAALPRALTPHHDIRVLIPGYRQILDSGIKITQLGKVAGYAGLPTCHLGRMDLDDGMIVYLILCPSLYERDGYPYGDNHGCDWSDNHLRFALLGHVAAEIAAQRTDITWRPQLIHANDWPSGLAPAYIAWRGLSVPSIFTIHNLMHHGLYGADNMPHLGIPAHAFAPDKIELHGQLSFLKAGIAYASHITTVSKTYARDITYPHSGCGLHDILARKSAQGLLSGFLNGIDESWEPYTDHHLLKDFNDWEKEGKALHARYLAEKFELDTDPGPLFAIVSRLVYQKGIDLTLQAADAIVAEGGKLIFFGRGEPELEAAVTALKERYPGRIAAHIGFNERDARRIYAGSDFLLMPSRFEPCGLSQMYAQRLGSLPVARNTGGLADTIEDGVNGFLFNDQSVADYLDAIRRALRTYRHPELLSAMRHKAMVSPQYWRESVKPYDQLYKELIKKTSSLATGFGSGRN